MPIHFTKEWLLLCLWYMALTLYWFGFSIKSFWSFILRHAAALWPGSASWKWIKWVSICVPILLVAAVLWWMVGISFGFRLVTRAWRQSTSSMGTTTLAVIGALIFPLADLWVAKKHHGWSGVTIHWRERLKYSAIIALWWWGALFSWHLFITVPREIKQAANVGEVPILSALVPTPPREAYIRIEFPAVLKVPSISFIDKMKIVFHHGLHTKAPHIECFSDKGEDIRTWGGPRVIDQDTIEYRWSTPVTGTCTAAGGAPSRSTPKPTDLFVSLITPSDPAIVVENQSDTLADRILWTLLIFRASDQKYFSFAAQEIGYVKPHSKSAPHSMQLNTLPHLPVGEQLTAGEIFIGTLSVDCPLCKGTSLVVSFVWGSSGWFCKVPDGNGRLLVPHSLSREIVTKFITHLNNVCKPEERQPII